MDNSEIKEQSIQEIQDVEQEIDEKKKPERKKDTFLKNTLDIVFTLVIAVIIAYMLNTYIFSFITVNKTSMYPTLNDKDIVFLNKTAYWKESPQSGEIIIFYKDRDGSKTYYVKRVIGLPGDVIELSAGTLYRNGVALDEPYISVRPGGYYYYEVPEGKYFVLGDNRAVSIDSKNEEIGFVDISEIEGKVVVKIKPYSKLEEYVHESSNK